jgi:hypothetical protein
MSETKRVIRHKKSGRYLAPPTWTDDLTQALVFDSITEAMEACRKYNLEDVELILHYGEERFDVALPICD